MAAIVISSPGGAQTNPTDAVFPFNNGGVFEDSMLVQNNPKRMYTTFIAGTPGAENGLIIDNGTGEYQFGDTDAQYTGNRLIINSPDGEFSINSPLIILNAEAEIQLNGALTSVSAGGNAGLHLKLNINGTKYKIQLLNN